MVKKLVLKKIKKVVKKSVNKATGKKKPKIKKKTSTEKKPAAKKEETRYTPPNAKGTKERVRPDTRKGRTVKVEAKKGTGTDIVPVNGKKVKAVKPKFKKAPLVYAGTGVGSAVGALESTRRKRRSKKPGYR